MTQTRVAPTAFRPPLVRPVTPPVAPAGEPPVEPAVTPAHRAVAAAPEARQRPLRRLRDAAASAGLHRPRVFRGARTERPFDAPLIRTPRLVLRPHRLTGTDADDWYELQAEPAVREFLPWPERDRRLATRHLRDRTRHTRLWQVDDFLALAMELDGRLVGDVSLHLREVAAGSRTVEIGWVVHPLAGGRGLATEAASALIDFAFAVVGARRVIAVTDARNTASVALATRLGFVETAAGHDDRESEFELAAPAAPVAARPAASAP